MSKRVTASPWIVTWSAETLRPFVPAGAALPSIVISGAPAYPVCDVPSTMTASVIAGSGAAGKIVHEPPTPMLKSMTSGPAVAFAALSASRSVQSKRQVPWSVSSGLVTV